MELQLGYAVLAGIVGAGLMVVAMVAGRLMGLATDMLRVLGLFFLTEESSPKAIRAVGLAVHLLMGAVFGLAYAGLLTWVGATTVVGMAGLWGILFGAIHGLVIGAGLGVLPAVHPRMGAENVLTPPGFFGRNIGLAMPVTLILLHVIYGVSAGLIYSAGVAG